MSRSSLLTKLAFRLPYTFLRLPSLYNIVWNFASHSNTFPFCFLQIRWNCSGDFAFSLNTTSNAIFVKARELLPPAMNQNLDWMKKKIFAKCFCKEAKIVSSQLWCLRKLKTFPRLSSSIFSCQQFLAISSPFQRRLPSNICIYLVFAIGSVFDSILVSWCQMSASPCNLLTSPIQHRFPQLLRLRSPILTRSSTPSSSPSSSQRCPILTKSLGCPMLTTFFNTNWVLWFLYLFWPPARGSYQSWCQTTRTQRPLFSVWLNLLIW